MLDLWSKKLLSGGKSFKPWTMVYLTTNGTVGGKEYASTGKNTNVWKAFTTGQEWLSGDQSSPANWVYYSPYPLRVSSVNIGIASTLRSGSVNLIIEGSNDNSQWGTLMSQRTVFNPGLLSINATEGYKYIRFRVPSASSDGIFLGNVTIYADAQY